MGLLFMGLSSVDFLLLEILFYPAKERCVGVEGGGPAWIIPFVLLVCFCFLCFLSRNWRESGESGEWRVERFSGSNLCHSLDGSMAP